MNKNDNIYVFGQGPFTVLKNENDRWIWLTNGAIVHRDWCVKARFQPAPNTVWLVNGHVFQAFDAENIFRAGYTKPYTADEVALYGEPVELRPVT